MRSARSSIKGYGQLFVALVALSPLLAPVSPAQPPEPSEFLGRRITITRPQLTDDGYNPKGPASVCLEGPPEPQCYTAPKDFGRDPGVTVVQIERDNPALLFSADSGGVSGWNVHFALLRPGTGKDLNDLLNVSAANQNQHAFWDVPEFSEAKIFVTANFVWGPDEGHYDPHRYTISVYVLEHPQRIGIVSYYLKDRYMTVRKYSQDANDDILGAEKSEIFAHLRRIKAEAEREQRPPR
jgi:hypothetical protein